MIGGLIGSLVLTLVLIPVVYAVCGERRAHVARTSGNVSSRA